MLSINRIASSSELHRLKATIAEEERGASSKNPVQSLADRTLFLYDKAESSASYLIAILSEYYSVNIIQKCIIRRTHLHAVVYAAERFSPSYGSVIRNPTMICFLAESLLMKTISWAAFCFDKHHSSFRRNCNKV